MPAKIIGPFPEEYRIVVDGFVVPNLTAHPIFGKEDMWYICLDHRLMIEASGAEVQRWAWLVANAMAFGSGYSCFGENSTKFNPYHCAVVEVDAENAPTPVPSVELTRSA